MAGMARALADSTTNEPRGETVARARINVFALPTRTWLLFSLIVLVLFLPLCATVVGRAPICGWFLLFWMIVLPLRDFFRNPAQQIRQERMTGALPRFPVLAQTVNEVAEEVAHVKPPRLLISLREGAFTFGTWTRRYIAMAESTARRAELDLRSASRAAQARARALILHELAHFAHRDVWIAYLTRSLLRVAIVFFFLDWLVVSTTPWLYASVVSLFDLARLYPPELVRALFQFEPAVMDALLNPRQIPPVVVLRYLLFQFTGHLPLVIGSVALLMFYWRALLRTREIYADLRVQQWQKSAEPLWQVLQRETAWQTVRATARGWRAVLESWGRRWISVNPLGLRGILSAHPSRETRRRCLESPHRIHGSDGAIAWTAGGAVVLLNVTLASLFLSQYVRGPNSGVPFLIGFVVIALSLLLWLSQFPDQAREYSKRVARIVLIFTAIKLAPQYLAALVFTLGVLMDPSAIDEAAYSMVLATDPNPPPLGVPVELVLENFVVRPAIYFTFGMPVILIGLLRLDARLKRRLFKWYGAPFLMRHPAWSLGGVTGLIAFALGFILLPILDAVVIPSAHDLLDPLTLIQMAFGTAVIAVAAFAWRAWDRRYAEKCPRCGASIVGEFFPGKICPACGELLHPQLCDISTPMSVPAIS